MLTLGTDGAGAAHDSMGHGGLQRPPRRYARCSNCGAKGATLRLPAWENTIVGYQAFPVERRRTEM